MSDLEKTIMAIMERDAPSFTATFNGAPISLRGQEWMNFAIKVLAHIEEYTIPQYGDKGEDLATTFTAENMMVSIKRYVARFGTNSREGQEVQDLMKIAHYACMAATKLQEEMKGA